jgi:serine/threonine-protein kinase
LRFDHPNVIKVFDVGRMDDGAPYMAMARLEGVTLSAVLRKRGHLRMPEVLELADAVCAGLSHAHACGVVHRDLKPHNIVQAHEPDGSRRWTILDFGISKPMDSEGTLTGESGVLGTPAYMSPEQARGLPVDARSDVFSLCSVLYRTLTGRPAFPGKDTPGIMFDVAYKMPDQPSLQAGGIPSDFDAVLALGLAKDPQDRLATPELVREALHRAAKNALDSTLRDRARALVERQPWGTHP